MRGVGNGFLVGFLSVPVFRSVMTAVLLYRSKQEQKFLRSK